jgi:hypothetical protein
VLLAIEQVLLNVVEDATLMKRLPHKGILAVATIAARISCSGQVYSQHIASFEERSKAIASTNFITFPCVSYHEDEICITTDSFTSGTNSFIAGWIVSTNTLANQPHWDGISNDIPLSISKACKLALPQFRKQFPDVRAWIVQSISLRKPAPESFPNVWCYDIVFEPRERDFNFLTNACPKRAILLMDGTLVLPTVAQ